ncbi:MAG: ROK family protein, partial [Clostridiales bacterium]|nr:ROK family protein [Clostridiales bacterium]
MQRGKPHENHEKDICGVSAGFPSTIDKDRKTLLSTPNIKGLNQVEAARILEEKLGVPAFVDKDVNCLLISDMHR